MPVQNFFRYISFQTKELCPNNGLSQEAPNLVLLISIPSNELENQKKKLNGPKGDLISESFSLWFQSLKIVPNHYPELYHPKYIVKRRCSGQCLVYFLGDWSHHENISVIKSPLPKLYIILVGLLQAEAVSFLAVSFALRQPWATKQVPEACSRPLCYYIEI